MKVRSVVKLTIISIFLIGLVFHISVLSYAYKIKEKAYTYLNAQGCNNLRVTNVNVNFNYKDLWTFKNPWYVKANVYDRYELILTYKNKVIEVNKQTDPDLIKKLNAKNLCNQEEDLFGEESKLEFKPVVVNMTLADFNKNKVKLIIYNNSNNTYMYGESYSLEYQKDTKWYQIIPLNGLVFDLIGYQIPSQSSADVEIDVSYHYGTLLPGKYRIIKELNLKSNYEKIVYVETRFEIK